MHPLENAIINSVVQANTKAEIRNPILKTFLVITPLLLTIHIVFDLFSLTIIQVVLFNYFLFAACIIDLRSPGILNSLRKFISIGILGLILLSNLKNVHIINDEIKAIFHHIYKSIPILNLLTERGWIFIFLIYTSIIAVKNFSSRDALWLGRNIFYKKMYKFYVIFIITISSLYSNINVLLIENIRTARLKFRLIKKVNPQVNKYVIFMKTFTYAFLIDFESAGDNIKTLIIQRGFFRISYKDPHGLHFGIADAISSIILILGFLVVYLAA